MYGLNHNPMPEQLKSCKTIAKTAYPDNPGFPPNVDFWKKAHMEHLERVASNCIDDQTKCIAFLHDIAAYTDENVWIELVEEGIDRFILDCAETLNHHPAHTYTEYISDILEQRRGHRLACVHVKLADLEDHLEHIQVLNDSNRDLLELTLMIIKGKQ